MDKTIIMDQKNLKKWQEAFLLTYFWQEKFSPVIAATLALGTLADQTPLGYVLAKQRLIVTDLPPINQKIILKGDVIKRKHGSKINYISCEAVVVYREKVIIRLTSTLMEQDNIGRKDSTKINEQNLKIAQMWRTFAPQQVSLFREFTEDPNPIHSGNQPIVQGMLLFLAVEDYLAAKKQHAFQMDVRYLHQIKANEEVTLLDQDTILNGIVSNKKCFEVKLSEGDE